MVSMLMLGALLAAQDAPVGEPVRCGDDRIVSSAADCVGEEGGPGPYMVFFRWGGVTFDRDGSAILDKVVAALADTATPYRLVLTGYSDRSGPATVNQRIARQRAELVARELRARGISVDAIQMRGGLGEEAPLVPTDDGVREAQNRRVEITFERID